MVTVLWQLPAGLTGCGSTGGTELGWFGRQSYTPCAVFEGHQWLQHWLGAAPGTWLGKAAGDQLLTSCALAACCPIY